MINYKYLSTAIVTSVLLSTPGFTSDDQLDPNKRPLSSSSSDDVIHWVQVKREKTDADQNVQARQQCFIPTEGVLKSVLSRKKGQNQLNPTGSQTNCLECSIALIKYINSGRIVRASGASASKPNIVVGRMGASLIDHDRAEQVDAILDRPDIIVLDGDKTYKFTDADGRPVVHFTACGMLQGEPNCDQQGNPIKQENSLSLQQTLEAIPLVNGKAVGMVYLEFLPDLKQRLGVDNGFTGHFQNFYIHMKPDGTKEILMVDAQDGDILTLEKFLSKNRLRSDPTKTMYYNNRMYVWWDRHAALNNQPLKTEAEQAPIPHVVMPISSSSGSFVDERDPETGKRARALVDEVYESENTNKKATLPPKEKEELHDSPAVQAAAHPRQAPAEQIETSNIMLVNVENVLSLIGQAVNNEQQREKIKDPFLGKFVLAAAQLYATQDNLDSQVSIALCHIYAIGCENKLQNKEKGLHILRNAANAGHTEAMYRLGYFLQEAIGCEDTFDNKREAVNWYREAANKGHVVAMNDLGYCLKNAIGCDNTYDNEREAVKCYREAANQGNIVAMMNICNCLRLAIGCEDTFDNKREAVKWYREAANKGHIEAMLSLGYCLQYAIGCENNPQNKKEGEDWFAKFDKLTHQADKK